MMSNKIKAGILLLGLLLAVSLFLMLSIAPDEPILYSDTNYNGNSFPLTNSYSDIKDEECEENWTKQISSITIPNGWWVELYSGRSYTGSLITLVSDIPDLKAIGWNEPIAAIKVFNGDTYLRHARPCSK